MNTLTVPKEVTKGETLVIIPKKEYEDFLDFKKQKQTAKSLDEDLNEALDDVKQGEVIGPFSSAKNGLKALKDSK